MKHDCLLVPRHSSRKIGEMVDARYAGCTAQSLHRWLIKDRYLYPQLMYYISETCYGQNVWCILRSTIETLRESKPLHTVGPQTPQFEHACSKCVKIQIECDISSV